MSGDPICTTHGLGFGTPCYMCALEEELKAERLALAEKCVRAGIEVANRIVLCTDLTTGDPAPVADVRLGLSHAVRTIDARAIAERVIAEDER